MAKRAAGPQAPLTLRAVVDALRKRYGPPKPLPTADPFELVLWENVAYLASPARRRDAFATLKRTVGTEPEAILGAKPQALESVTARGILEETFAGKLRECASIVLERLDGDLAAAVRGPIDRAKRALCLFPGIGEPGAEKILLFSGREALLAPESNGLRVLCRLGLVTEEKSYAATYAAARDVAKDLPAKPSVLQEAHLLLQQHGQTLCKRSAPRCEECPLFPACEYAAASRSAREQRVPPSKRKGTSTRGRGRRRLS